MLRYFKSFCVILPHFFREYAVLFCFFHQYLLVRSIFLYILFPFFTISIHSKLYTHRYLINLYKLFYFLHFYTNYIGKKIFHKKNFYIYCIYLIFCVHSVICVLCNIFRIKKMFAIYQKRLYY